MFFSTASRSAWTLPSALRTWSYGGFLALLLLGVLARPTIAQVPLQLLHRVDSTGQNAFEGRPLPSQTTVVLLRYPAERPHTLESAGIPRKELARLVLTRLRSRDTTIWLNEEGKTTRRYSLTAQSDRIVYVLARTPNGSLYESYVNTGNGFAPGFDAIQSGRMVMGPVAPRKARRRFRAVFRLSHKMTSVPDTTSRTESSDAPDSVPARATASQNTTKAPPQSENEEDATSQSEDEDGVSPVWTFLLGGLIGGLIGSGAAWLMFSDRLRRAEEDRTKLQRQLREIRNQEFREATGSTFSAASKSENDTPTESSSPDELKRLREENETLERQIEEIKQHLQNLRDPND